MSNISLGKKVRMSRMVNPVSNKMMAITVDHAISRGIAPMTGLHSIQSTIDKIVAGKPDAMTVTPGILNQCWDAEKNRRCRHPDARSPITARGPHPGHRVRQRG